MQTETKQNIIDENRWKIDPSGFNGGQDPDKLIRFLPDICREDLDAIVTLLKGTPTIDAPEAENKHWAGTWYCGRLYLDYDRNKKLSLFQVLHRGGTSVADIRTLNGCQYRYTSTLYISQETVIVLPDSESGIEYERSSVIKDNDTSRFTYSITKKERLYQTVPEHVSRVSAAGSSTHAEHLGVREGNVDQDGNPVVIPDMTVTGGTILRMDVVKQSDCTKNVTIDKTTPVDQTSVSEDHSAARDAVETLHTEGATIADKAADAGTIRQIQETPTEAGNVRTTDKVITPKDQASTGGVRSAAADTDIEEHTEGEEITDLSASTGTIRRVDQTPTEAGNMRTRDAVTTPKDQTSVSEDHSAARDAVETLHTEGATIADKAASAGTIRQVQEIPTEAGNVRTTDKVITPKDQASTGGVRSAAADTDIEEHTEGEEITDLSASTGTIRRVDQTPTEAGNMRTRDAVTTPKDQTSVSEDHSAARDAVETLHTEGTTIADKAADEGTIRQIQETPTEAGNVRTVDKVITPKDQESAGGVHSAAADTVIEEHTEGDAITDLSAAGGTIRRVDQTPTEAGNMRTRDAVTTPKDQTSVSEDHSAARDAVETLHTEGATIADKSASAGTIRQVQETPTEAGNVRTTDKVITPLDQESTSKITQSDEITEIEEHTEGAEITDFTAAAGTIRRVDNTPTEAGNMRTRDAVTTRQDQSIASGNVVKTPRQTSVIEIIDGAEDPPDALAEGEYGRVSYKKDRFGRYVGDREVTTYSTDFTIPGWVVGTDSAVTYNVKSFIQKAGTWYMMSVPVTVIRSWHTSSSSARTASAVHGDCFGQYKSGYKALGPCQFVATDVSIGTPTFTEQVISTGS